jgi:dTDP-4-dehydrorhamnose 3,5-epimerase
MQILPTLFKGLFVIEPKVFEDSRGYFFESYNQQNIEKAGIDFVAVQDNQSKSQYGVIRGLHYQLNPYAQSKLIRVLDGTIRDIVVDIRKDSPTYKQSFAIELSADNKKQLFVPKGFAHGFSVLSENAVVLYKVDSLYHPQSERGILFSDASLQLDWGIELGKEIVSARDLNNPIFDQAEFDFIYA